MSRNTRELALAAMLAALAAAMLLLGGLFPFALYIAPILASFAVLAAREECAMRYAAACYAAAAILGVMLSPDKEGALVFAALGYYPLLKPRLDALHRPVRRLLKLALFLLAAGGLYALLIFVFQLDAVVQELRSDAPWMIALTCALGLALWFVYDAALGVFTSIYRARRRRK